MESFKFSFSIRNIFLLPQHSILDVWQGSEYASAIVWKLPFQKAAFATYIKEINIWKKCFHHHFILEQEVGDDFSIWVL